MPGLPHALDRGTAARLRLAVACDNGLDAVWHPRRQRRSDAAAAAVHAARQARATHRRLMERAEREIARFRERYPLTRAA